MLKGAIARRYAGAIFDIGMKQNTLDRTLEDVQEIAKLFSIRKLAYLLREPNIPAEGKKIVLETRVQPDILGGVVARVGDQVIDGSVERRLKLLQQQLLTGVSSARIDFFAEPG